MFEYGSKAKNLGYAKNNVSLFCVPSFLTVNVCEFLERKTDISLEISHKFKGKLVAVRSSAADEDGERNAMAGEYDSLLNVDADNVLQLQSAIIKVIDSYNRKRKSIEGDEVIIQEMVRGVSMSGVAFTHDLNTGAPYYVINYDDISGATDAVTSGGEYANRTLYIHRGSASEVRSMRFKNLLHAIKELESVVGSEFLDIEFALDFDFRPYLLQVRAITTQPNWNRGIVTRINAALQGIQGFLKDRMKAVPGVYGRTTVLGQMPDWNPAEMIGRAPRALAFSLYSNLITNSAWRIGRARMGYAVPAGQALMVALGGQPFIDTRLSFHSYLPNALPASIAEKLVDAWVEKLRANPELHDKVEFDVAITTYSFDFDEKVEEFVGGVISKSEAETFKDLAKEQLLSLLDPSHPGSIDSAMESIKSLEKRQFDGIYSQSEASLSLLQRMLEDCQRDGTIPFAILARHGFIAKTLMNSLLHLEILDEDDIEGIQGGIQTVAGDLVDWMRQLQNGYMDRSRFMDRFGHLRPGTYDILSRRYDQMLDLSVKSPCVITGENKSKFQLSESKNAKINDLLLRHGFCNVTADTLLDYFQNAIVGREYGKLIFTRTVSDILELIACYGEARGLSREELSHVPLSSFLDIVTASGEHDVEQRLRDIAHYEAERHILCSAIRLPQVLADEAGVHVIPFQVSVPNFITQKEISAPAIVLTNDDPMPCLNGKIVMIESADPGFDWIFSEKIAGLITKYGGANSHMAIRCAEFGIPAAIGCGEQRYETLKSAAQIALDCSSGTINPFH